MCIIIVNFELLILPQLYMHKNFVSLQFAGSLNRHQPYIVIVANVLTDLEIKVRQNKL